MLLTYKNGQQSVVLPVVLLDAAGEGLTGLTSASTGLIISTRASNEATATSYTESASTIESVTTLGTYEAPTATKCRFREIDATNMPGWYEIHFADARYAVSNAERLDICIHGATNLLQSNFSIQLVSDDPYVSKPTNFDLLGIDGSGLVDISSTSVDAITADIDANSADLSTIISHLTDIKGATFNTSTDSLEAIRNNHPANFADLFVELSTGRVELASQSIDAITADIDSTSTVLSNIQARIPTLSSAALFESFLDGSEYMPVDPYKIDFTVSGNTLTVKKPDDTTTAYTKTLNTDAGALPVISSV